MRLNRAAGLTLAGLLVAVPAGAQSEAGGRDGRTVEVRMVDKGPTEFVFEPSSITVRPGDRVVWVQTGVMPHNVEFSGGPGDADLSALPSSPFLVTRGQRYEVVIDERFTSGGYEYICTPHAALGMTGTIEVLPAETGQRTVN